MVGDVYFRNIPFWNWTTILWGKTCFLVILDTVPPNRYNRLCPFLFVYCFPKREMTLLGWTVVVLDPHQGFEPVDLEQTSLGIPFWNWTRGQWTEIPFFSIKELNHFLWPLFLTKQDFFDFLTQIGHTVTYIRPPPLVMVFLLFRLVCLLSYPVFSKRERTLWR